MKSLIIKTIRDHLYLTIFMSLFSVLTVLMYVSLFPTISKQSQDYEKLLSSFPKEMWEVFGLQAGNFSMNTLEKYLTVELFSFMWPILSIILFSNIAIQTISGEIDKGTMEILLSQPISRTKIILSKIIAGTILVSFFVFISIFSIIGLAELLNIKYEINVYYKLFLICLLFSYCGFSITILLSSIVDKAKTSIISIGLLLSMYIINVIATIKDNLEKLQYLSFFHYFNASKVLSESKFEEGSIIIFSVISIISIISAIIYFSKRDIYV